MKRILCTLLLVCIFVSNAVLVSSEEYVPEVYTEEQILTIDSMADADNDGLVDRLELVCGFNQSCSDTDYDGINDYIEFFITHTDLTTPDGYLDSDNDGLTNIEEISLGTDPGSSDTDGDRLTDNDELSVFGTDPLLADSDGDGLFDDVELNLGLDPLLVMSDGETADAQTTIATAYMMGLSNNSVSGSTVDSDVAIRAVVDPPFPVPIAPGSSTIVNAVLRTTINGELCSSDVSYNSSFNMFFGSNTTYNPEIAVVSSLLAANAYATNYVDFGGSISVTAENSMEVWMDFHNMEHFAFYDLHEDTNYNDNHVSRMYVAHKRVICNGMVRNIICVVIRGTDGADEWESNFDIGTTLESPRTLQWTNVDNHKGFDITANRLNMALDEYIETYCPGTDNVFWITGHSRGGALANLLAAKRVDDGEIVYAYTFASPNTTTKTVEEMGTDYNCIFNIINEDDYVTKLPMTGWNFRRYGIDKTASIGNQYKAEWNAMTNCTGNIIEGYGGGYNYDEIGLESVLQALTDIADDRDNCYFVRLSSDGYFEQEFLAETDRDEAKENMLAYYAPNMLGTYSVSTGYENGFYYYRIYQKPTFLMQLLAAYMGSQITIGDFVAINAAPYLSSAKLAIASAGWSGMAHPHVVESYYLLSTKLT